MAMFYNLAMLYCMVGAVASFYFRDQIKMVVGLAMTVLKYDAPDGLTDDQLHMMFVTIYLIGMVIGWPYIVPYLNRLK